MKSTRKMLLLSVLGLGTALMQTVHADSVYLFVGDKVPSATRTGSIHRYEFDAAKPGELKPAPSAGLPDDYWDKSTPEVKGSRIADIVIGPDGDVYAAARDLNSVVRYDGKTGELKGTVIRGLVNPEGMAIGPDGLLYITNKTNIVRYTLAGKPMPGAEQIGNTFSTGGDIRDASGISFGPDGNLYVASQTTNQVLRFDGVTGKFMGIFTGAGIGAPSEMAWGPDGNLYLASTAGPGFNAESGYVAKIDGLTGKIIDGFSTEAKGALGLIFAPDGNLIVTDYFTAQMKRYDAKTGKLLGNLAFSPSGANFYFMAFASKADTPNAPLKAWSINVPKRPAKPAVIPATAQGASTVKGWENGLVPKGVAGPLLNLADKKATSYTIALPANASTQDQKAAAVLAHHLREMTGATFPIVNEGAGNTGGKVISVGQTELLKKSGLLNAKIDLGEEGLAINAKGENLYLWGGTRRGAIYAVYSLLEEDLGCRWYTPEPGGERFPRVAKLSFKPTIRHFKPVLDVRDPYYLDAFVADWSLENKTNAYEAAVPMEFGGYAKHSLFTHTYNNFIPPAQYFEKHPEYFAEVNGKRTPSQLELTNPDVLKLVIEGVRKSLRENPSARYISVSPNDGRGYSESKESRAIDEAEATVPGSKSGTLIWFCNKVAEAIEDEFPDVKISTLAYLDTFMPPKTIRPHKNLVIQLCTDSHAWKYQYNFIHESKDFQKAMKAWNEIGAPIHIWDYTASFVHYQVPMPNMPVVSENMRWLIDNGAKGIMLQGVYGSLGGENTPMRDWVWAKQLFDPSLDTKALMKDFIFGYYGDAAQPVWEYNMMLWDLWVENRKLPREPGVTPIGVNPLIIDSPMSANPDWVLFDKTYLDKTTAYFERAEALAKDPVTAKRIRTAKLPLLYVKLGQGLGWITEFSDYNSGSWVKKPDAAGHAKYKALYEEYVDIVQETGVRAISERSVIGDITGRWDTMLNMKWGETPVVKLSDKWSFKTDPQKVGATEKWFAGPTGAGWSEVYSNKKNGWESQGFADYKGVTWYRQEFKLPDSFEKRDKKFLYFGAVDSEAEVYLNGTKIFDHTMATTGITLDRIWNEPFAIDVTRHWKEGEANTVAVRAESYGGVRGVWKPAFLVGSNDDLKAADIQTQTIPYQ